MSDKIFYERGGECVAGDLILNRQIMGRYRNGQFIMTPEGANELENVVEVPAREVKTEKAPKAKAAKAKAEKAPAPAPAEELDDDLAGLLDDLGD